MKIEIEDRVVKEYIDVYDWHGMCRSSYFKVYNFLIDSFAVLIPVRDDGTLLTYKATDCKGRPVTIGPKTNELITKKFKEFFEQKNTPVKIFE